MREVLSTAVLDNDVYVFMTDGTVHIMIVDYAAEFRNRAVKFKYVGRVPDVNQTDD